MRRLLLNMYRALVKTIEHDGIEHAGYMSFMVLLSIFPFIVFFLALTSFFGASELGSHFVNSLIESLPDDATAAIKENIYELVKAPPYRLMTLAIIGTIWTSSSFVEGMRTILNRIYNINTPPPYLFRRLLSIMQFLIINIMIFLAMLLLVFIPIGLEGIPEIQNLLNNYGPFWTYFRYFLILTTLLITVSAFYYVIPNVSVKLKDIIPGAIMTVVLWMISGNLLSNYLVYYNQLSILYGSLGSIIVTLLFFYITNMIFIYGAEFNYQIFTSQKAWRESHERPESY
ncbi:MAG: YihY/virulence factor BrkB family protein [Pseudomonadota bacterium]